MRAYSPEGFNKGTNENKRYNFTKTQLWEAAASGEILEGLAYMCDSEHNLLVNLGSMKGIIPRFEGALGISIGTTRDIALISRVGKPVCFVVEQIKTDSSGVSYAILSRRAAQERCKNEFLSGLVPGDIIPAKVTHLETFGAFCDVGCGNIALLPIDSISISRISHPRDRFSVGDDIKVIVKNIDEQGRMTLSHKELLGTWQQNADTVSQGETVSGVVRSIENYGIFIELSPNLAGLAESRDGVRVGQTASVYIKSIIPDKMKVKLIIIDSFDSNYSNPVKYFYEGDHIDSFIYSPEGAGKIIETKF
ncbi:MAG: 30S ribosomal protein S1 [Clostridia bacterium]|nr:30S ribosomal protein S1 [Clostridia bacterium]